jgi:hypothetical protein
MGTLRYDGTSVEFDDRLLAHVEAVIMQKLRRQESFFLAWRESDDLGGGRTAVWMNTSAMLTIHFTGRDTAELDRQWLERLMISANSMTGLLITDADGRAAHPTSANYAL